MLGNPACVEGRKKHLQEFCLHIAKNVLPVIEQLRMVRSGVGQSFSPVE
jgi:hypothetical protein